jgi:hypothetical protein
LWSRDGRELFFTTGGRVGLIAAGVNAQPSLTFTNPIALPRDNAWMDGFNDAAREWDVFCVAAPRGAVQIAPRLPAFANGRFRPNNEQHTPAGSCYPCKWSSRSTGTPIANGRTSL